MRARAIIILVSSMLAMPMVARANPGSLDRSWGSNGVAKGAYGYMNDIAVQPDGKIIVTGCSGGGCDFSGGKITLARFTAGGRVDRTFGGTGTVTTDVGENSVAFGVALQPDGKIVVAGGTCCDRFGWPDFALVRYNRNGSLDTSFGQGGIVVRSITDIFTSNPVVRTTRAWVAHGVAIQRDGRIVAGGATSAGCAVARFLADGRVDDSFGPPPTPGRNGGQVYVQPDLGAQCYDVALQRDGKIVLAGDFQNKTATGDAVAIRFRKDGSFDSTFGRSGIASLPFRSAYRAVQGVGIQPDGRIVVVGNSDIGRSGDFAVGRFTSSGKPDASFGRRGIVVTDFGSTSVGRDEIANDVAVSADGKIVVAGTSARHDGAEADRFVLARYRRDGTLDPTFGARGKVLSLLGLAGAVVLRPRAILVAGTTGPATVARYIA